MEKTQILADVQEIMRDVFDLEDLAVTNETNAGKVEEWDSLSHIRLVVALEKHFAIRFAFGELQELKNVGEMIELIQEKLEE